MVRFCTTTAPTTTHFNHSLKVTFEIHGIRLIIPLQPDPPIGYGFEIVVVEGVLDCGGAVTAGAEL
jgi:hypothetical protein